MTDEKELIVNNVVQKFHPWYNPNYEIRTNYDPKDNFHSKEFCVEIGLPQTSVCVTVYKYLNGVGLNWRTFGTVPLEDAIRFKELFEWALWIAETTKNLK